MNAAPDVDAVLEAARMFGFRLTRQDAVVYRRRIAEALVEIERFVSEAKEGDQTPCRRHRGARPTSVDDPFGAWLWRCSIHGASEGVLHGRTVGFKDHIPVAGIPMTLGTRALRDYIPDFDATVVRRVLAAGATVVGKNSLDSPTGGWGVPGRRGEFPRTTNPHDARRVPGGSSAGSAVAVVAGQVDISFGGDQAGSIRIPAAWSGCIGVKPTFGLVSHHGIGFGSDASLDHVGPLARTFEHAAAALDAVAGRDGLDPRQTVDVPELFDASSGLDGGVQGLRIGLLDEAFVGVDDDVCDVVLAAADVLRRAGARVTRVSLPAHLEVHSAIAPLWSEGARALFVTGFLGTGLRTAYPESLISAAARLWHDDNDATLESIRLNYLIGEFSWRRHRGLAYARAQNERRRFAGAVDALFADVDVLAMPTTPKVAPFVEEPANDLESRLGSRVSAGSWFVRNTAPYSYSGHPAVAVPCGKADGLPVSMQLVGRRMDDALLLRAGYAFQHSVDWAATIAVGESIGA